MPLRALLESNTSLYDIAARAPGAIPISGRGPAYVAPINGERWLVRHYRRGGAVAALLRDRYLALGNRALHELRVGTAARAAGIPTPEVIAAIRYPAGMFARYDIAVAFIDHAKDLAALLFDQDQVPDVQLTKAAVLIHAMIERGLVHADLNLKNILVAPDRAYILDLDRCKLTDGVSQSEANRMRKRLLRSLEKWQRQTGRFVHDRHRRTLEEAFHV